MPARQSLALGIWISVGGRYENDAYKGIAHYLEHLIFKGSKKYSCRKIKESIEGVGGALNGFTSEELTCYLVKMPSTYSGLALNILSDMVINPSIPAEEVQKERTVILEEIKMYKDQPQSHVHELLDELLWPKQALGTPIIGYVQSVNKITRNDIASFRHKFYTPANMVISAAGSFKQEQLVKSVKRIFSPLKKSPKNVFLPVQEGQTIPQLEVLHKDTEQTHLALGFHGFKRDHPLRHALGIMHVILGANMSSRLFEELREKRGLAYEIGTQVKRFHDTGAFIVHAGIDNRKVPQTLNLIFRELKKIKNKLVTDGEFRRAKEFYLGQLMLALEDSLDHMLWIGETTATLDKAYSLGEIVKEIRRVEKDDIRQAAKQIFKGNNLNLALIGPLQENRDKIYKELRIE